MYINSYENEPFVMYVANNFSLLFHYPFDFVYET